MGDLQSPQYVKRTAHMFNSRYASPTPHNGSAVPDENRKITPSYLNVSRSISGYSCLSYNGSSNGYHGPNGATPTGRLAPIPHRTTTAPTYSNGSNYSHNNGSHTHSTESDCSIKYKSSGIRGPYDGDVNRPNPPALPKTAPPLYSPALTIGNVREVPITREVPIAREKSSFILNRIERLCGSAEVMSSWRRPGINTPPQPMRAEEKIIPIVLEDEQENVLKPTPGRHNLLTDNNVKVATRIGRDDAGRQSSEVGEYAKKNSKEIPDNEDSLDGENCRKAIPVHRNGNFKDYYDIGSKTDMKETPESGVLLYGNTKSMSLKSPVTLAEPASPVPASFTKTLTDGNMETLTSKRLPLTQVSRANPSAVVETKKFDDKEILPSQNKENERSSGPVEKNGDYFLLEMEKEKCKLDKLVEIASERLNTFDPSSEEAGKIRAAIGKANLLCTKKFKQFRELCHTNLEQSRKGTSSDEPFTTKNDDLAGFWDMVLIQVGQIHSMFEELDPNRAPKPSSAISLPTPKVPVSRRPNSAKTSPTTVSTTNSKQKSESSALRDESRRKLLAEKRKAMKNQVADTLAQSEPEVQIFTPSSN